MRDGEQHRETPATRNPFINDSISGYTATEIATLQARLEKQLGPEYISHRSNGASGKVSYLEAFKVINLANEVFGFNGWSSEVRNIHIDFVDEKADHRFNVGLSVTARVTLRDGTFHEDVGYGSIENCRGKAAAFEKCKKEGTTDAMKRALRNFGNVLGNCLYDKTFLSNIAKVKAPTTKFDPELLHRLPEFSLPDDHPKMQMPRAGHMSAPIVSRKGSVARSGPQRQESLRSDNDNYGDDIFDGLDFEEDRPGNYDEVTMDESMAHFSPDHSMTSNALQADGTNGLNHDSYMAPAEFMKPKAPVAAPQQAGPRQVTMTQSEAKRLHALRQAEKEKTTAVTLNGNGDQRHPPSAAPTNQARPPPPPFMGEPIHPIIDGATEAPANYQPSFMNSRTLVQPTGPPALFDPKVSSPSLPKSGLADPTRSTPIKRPGSTPVSESPVGNGSPLRRMASSVAGAAPGFSRSGVSQFRAPSKLNQTTATGDGQPTSKRGSEALVEHPPGSISLNVRVVSDGGSAEKKLKN